VQTRASANITTILTYILAALVIFQGMMMLYPIAAIRMARDVIVKDHRRRKREVELAQIFPDIWVQHILKIDENKNRTVVRGIRS
jgi:hypothetical protein